MKIVSLDIETTGLDPEKDDIVEFGAVLDDLGSIRPIDQLPRFQCYFYKDKFSGSPYALSMHPKIFRKIADYMSAGYLTGKNVGDDRFYQADSFGAFFKDFLVANGYEKKLGQITINAAGKNFGAFDLQFLKHKTDLLTHVNVRHRIIDPSILFIEDGDESLPSTEVCKKRAGISGEVAHNAIDDALDVIRLIRFKLCVLPFGK